MARMLTWFGDRDLAMFYYRQSSEVDVSSKAIQDPPANYHTILVSESY